MNKRLYERVNVLEEIVPVKITINGKDFKHGLINDFNKSGMSFYNYSDEILNSFGKYVDVSFIYKDAHYNLSLEILREKKYDNGYLCAGKFVGVPCAIKRKLSNLLAYAETKILVNS